MTRPLPFQLSVQHPASYREKTYPMGTAEVVGPGTGGEQGRVVDDDDVGVDAETTLTDF